MSVADIVETFLKAIELRFSEIRRVDTRSPSNAAGFDKRTREQNSSLSKETIFQLGDYQYDDLAERLYCFGV